MAVKDPSLGWHMAQLASGNMPSVRSLVEQYAPQFGVDPEAVMRVSGVEGGGRWGAVGDQGTSFGPWQLHIGGALPAQYATPTAAAAFANSPEGVKYVLAQMGKVAGGLTGKAAVAAIVRRFERPADPEGEIAKAMGAAGPWAAPGSGVPAVPGASPLSPPPKLGALPGFSSGLKSSLASLMAPPVPGMAADPGTAILASTLASQKAFGAKLTRQMAASRPQQAPGAPSAPSTPGFEAAPESGTWLSPGAKIIGTPGQGTHTVGNWQSDNAIDIALPQGTPIYAPVSGKLGNTGLLPGAGASGGGRFSGERINLFGGGQGFYFAHLSQLAPGIKQGAQVKAGQLLGYTGEANGVQHLHFGVEKGDPRSYYG